MELGFMLESARGAGAGRGMGLDEGILSAWRAIQVWKWVGWGLGTPRGCNESSTAESRPRVEEMPSI